MSFLEKHKNKIIASLAVICVGFIIYSVYFRSKPSFAEDALGYLVTPVQKAFSSVGDYITGCVSFFAHMNRLEKENNRLIADNETLTDENNRLRLLEEEQVKLLELFDLSIKYPKLPTLGARVIALDPGPWYNAFIIDKGRKDGVEANMVILAQNGLVGRVLEAGANYAKVVSLIDDTSSVSATILRSKDSGFVVGELQLMNKGLCKMEFNDLDADVAAGDEIITSDLSDVYPPGIVIGYVRSISTDMATRTKYALIDTVVDFSEIDMVLVVNQLYEPARLED